MRSRTTSARATTRNGRPWTSPVCFAAAGVREFYWISEIDAQHSRNLTERPQVRDRTFHAGFHVEGGIEVFDVWESMDAFEAFGAHLMPILEQNGIDPGEPQISDIELIITSRRRPAGPSL